MEGERQKLQKFKQDSLPVQISFLLQLVIMSNKAIKQNKTSFFIVKRNIKSRSHNRYCSGIDTSTKRFACVSLFLPYFTSKNSACAILYCHLCPVMLYHIFPHYPTNRTIFDKEISTKFLFWFSLQLGLKHLSL